MASKGLQAFAGSRTPDPDQEFFTEQQPTLVGVGTARLQNSSAALTRFSPLSPWTRSPTLPPRANPRWDSVWCGFVLPFPAPAPAVRRQSYLQPVQSIIRFLLRLPMDGTSLKPMGSHESHIICCSCGQTDLLHNAAPHGDFVRF